MAPAWELRFLGSSDWEVAREMQFIGGDTDGGHTWKWKLNQTEREVVRVSGHRLTGDTQTAKKRSFYPLNQLTIITSLPHPLKVLESKPGLLLGGGSVQSHLDKGLEKLKEGRKHRRVSLWAGEGRHSLY